MDWLAIPRICIILVGKIWIRVSHFRQHIPTSIVTITFSLILAMFITLMPWLFAGKKGVHGWRLHVRFFDFILFCAMPVRTDSLLFKHFMQTIGGLSPISLQVAFAFIRTRRPDVEGILLIVLIDWLSAHVLIPSQGFVR